MLYISKTICFYKALLTESGKVSFWFGELGVPKKLFQITYPRGTK